MLNHNDRIMASSLTTDPTIKLYEDLAARMQDLDLTCLLVYNPATVPAPALYALAEQFGVTGDGGWNAAETDEARRELIKRAIELQKHKGTPWAIREVLRSVGFTDVEITEGPDLKYDGKYPYDGTRFYGDPDNWAIFRVRIYVPDINAITVETEAKVIGLINEYKNERSQLLGVIFVDDDAA